MKCGEKNMYNFKQCVTKSNTLMYTILLVSSKIWKDYDRVLYIIFLCY